MAVEAMEEDYTIVAYKQIVKTRRVTMIVYSRLIF